MAGELYREIAPQASLAPYIECYWCAEGRPEVRAILPDGCVDILYTARKGEPAALSVVGLMTVPRETRAQAQLDFFGVRFRPGMAHWFLPEAPRLGDRIEPLFDFWGAPAGELFEQLAESGSAEEKAGRMDRYLARRQPERVPVPLRLRSAELSTRHFRRVCLDETGVSPKFLARILRFRRAADRIAAMATRARQPAWAEFALESGYADQAHLIREFRAFSGQTPGRFFQYRAADSAYTRSDGTSET